MKCNYDSLKIIKITLIYIKLFPYPTMTNKYEQILKIKGFIKHHS